MNIVMTRLIEPEREQVAMLKAFGYGRVEIGWHYLKMVLVLVVVGSTRGRRRGRPDGVRNHRAVHALFHFPVLNFSMDPPVIGSGLLLSGGSAIAGTLGAVWRAMRQPPAEAMRPNRRRVSGRPWLSEWVCTLLLAGDAHDPPSDGAAPHATILSALGIALAVSILVLGNFTGDAVTYAMDTYFHLAQLQDVTVLFGEPSEGRGA